jgi:hypothetical protein
MLGPEIVLVGLGFVVLGMGLRALWRAVVRP